MNGTTTAHRILIVDDDEDDFFLTSEHIRHIPGAHFDIDWCYRYDDALDHMIDRDYALYFVDYRLGARTGMDLLKAALHEGCEEPIILLTGKGNRDIDLEAMQVGATDYLIKSELNTEKLERCIRYALERAASTKALRANERKYRNMFEKSKDLVFITDDMLDFQDVNEACVETLGYSREELLQMNLCDLIDQPQQKKFLLDTLQSKGAVDDWEVSLATSDGEKRQCMLSASQEKTSYDFLYIQGIAHDITNLRRAERATLQGEKLAATGRLVRTLAHEVRNPLNNITLSVEQLLSEGADEMEGMYLGIIQRNSKRISDLISELLNTSRPSEIQLSEMVLQSVLDEVLSVAIDRITLKRIKLDLNFPATAVPVMADLEKLKIAILNIVINAVEAMEEGTGIIRIAIEPSADTALVSITDNGCGIPEENISRLFEPYFTQKRNGMGLGLASTLNIIQAHGASIEVKSEVGSGTTFRITFPLVGKPAVMAATSSETALR